MSAKIKEYIFPTHFTILRSKKMDAFQLIHTQQRLIDCAYAALIATLSNAGDFAEFQQQLRQKLDGLLIG